MEKGYHFVRIGISQVVRNELEIGSFAIITSKVISMVVIFHNLIHLDSIVIV